MPAVGKGAVAPAKLDPAKVKAKSAKGKAAKPPAPESTERTVIHPEVVSKVFRGEEAITADIAKEILGWEVETKKGEFGGDYLLEHEGKRVRCVNNPTNRPLMTSTVAVLKQEHLRKRWRLNGEPIIIGRTGLVLNGQHTLISLIFAVTEYYANPDTWNEYWKEEPTLEKVVTYGIEEDDETVNTMDTCKPRTLADVIYRARYFKGMKMAEHRALSRSLDLAIRKLWERSGTYEDPYSVSRTHSESIAYLERHPKLIEAVKHIYEEDGDKNKLGRYLNRGSAAAALYFMGSSDSSSDVYYNADHPSEDMLDWGLWEKACQFWVELASGKSLKAVLDYINQLIDEQGEPTQSVRWAVIAKAWDRYRQGEPVTVESVTLEFDFKDDHHHLSETPYFGGIDVGMEGLPFNDLSPTEIKEAAAEVRQKQTPLRIHNAPTKTTWKKGDTAWVHGEFEEPAFALIQGTPYDHPSGVRKVAVSVGGAAHHVCVDSLSLSQTDLT